jgi:AraC-like DNA-binding protein
MEPTDGLIVVMRPGAVATGAVIAGDDRSHSKPETELITGHDLFLYVAQGEGTYRVNGRAGILRPNTLVAAPAGTFACSLSFDREMYIVAVREPDADPTDASTFIPFLERQLSASEGRQWHARMMEHADRAAAGRFGAEDIGRLKSAVRPYMWKREANAAQDTLHGVLASIWERLGEPLTLEGLGREFGYTANYLNDLTRVHTGRALGSWIAEMRMARARAALEQTDRSVAEIGASCGYDDPAYFSRAFRRVHGVPPATWRIAARPVDARYASVTLPIDLLHEIEQHRHRPQPAYSFAS